MTNIEADSLVVIDGPVRGLLQLGEAARVISRTNDEALVFGLESVEFAKVPVSSLSPLDEEYNLLLEVHDYVFEGDDE